MEEYGVAHGIKGRIEKKVAERMGTQPVLGLVQEPIASLFLVLLK